MSVVPSDPALQTPEAASAADTAVPTPEPALPAAAATSGQAAEDVASLPEWAQKLIGKTRTEAATHRTKANEQSQALEATRDAIAKALGLKSDDDPVKAAQTAAEQRDAALAEAKKIRVENAVLRAAQKAGADSELLTDSRSFMLQLETIEPAAEDFSAQIEAAILKALETNPALKTAAQLPRSGGPVGGGVPIPGQLTRDDLKGMSTDEINKAREDGRLNSILGITS